MASNNSERITELGKQIEALESERSRLRSEDAEAERKAQEDKWKRDNADGIEFCKTIVSKPFTFGKDVIKHYYWKPFDTAIEYDYVSVYFPLHVDYVDKNSVNLLCRHLDTGMNYVRLSHQHQMNLRVSYLTGTYKPTEHEHYDGGIHLLTDDELKIAFDFWQKKACEVFEREFTLPSNKPWLCSFNPNKIGRIFDRDILGVKPKSTEDKKEEPVLTEDEKFRKDRETVLAARKAYYEALQKSDFAGILRAEERLGW